MRRVLLVCLLLAVFAVAKTVPLSMNVSAATTLEPGDFILIDGYPSPWGYHRVVLGVQPSGAGALEGFVSRNSCQYTLVGYYQQLDFVFDGEPVLLEYTGNSSINVLLQWWLDYSAVQSQCEEPSVSASELTTYLDSTYQAYSDLGPLGSTSSFESSNEMLKITEYPSWNHNTLVVQIESNDGNPLDGFVYVGIETLKISGNSVAIPLSRRSFLPATFQISFPTIRKFTVRWWANHLNAQDIPVQMTVSSNQGQDSIYCEYSFPGTRERNVSLGYSANDFADGNAPAYTAKSTLEDAALGLVANSFYVGTVYDIQANISNGKTITLALPLETISNVDRENLLVYHESNGVIETIVPDSIAGGFVYFRTSSCSKFWTCVKKSFINIGKFIGNGVAALVGAITDGVQVIVDGIHDFYNWLVEGFCDIFDSQTWADFFSINSDNASVNHWDLPEGKMPDQEFTGYNPYLFDIIEAAASLPLEQITDVMSDAYRLNATTKNLDIMLSELVNRKMKAVDNKRFGAYEKINLVDGDTSEHVANYLAVSTALTKYSFDMVKILNECYDAANPNSLASFFYESAKFFTGMSTLEKQCQNILGAFGIIDYMGASFDCSADLLKLMTQVTLGDDDGLSAFKNNRDDLILKTTDVLARVALLAYYDKSMREPLGMWFIQSYRSLSTMIAMMGPLMLYNNITIKAEAAMALFEYVYWGGTTHLENFRRAVKIHYGENGGFSEGTGYLQYINEDVPYLMVALKKAHAQMGQEFVLPQEFYNSGYYLKDMSRNVLWNKAEGFKLRIPIEIDDGCTYTPEYSVWGTLTGDDIFFRMAKKYPIDSIYSYSSYRDDYLQPYTNQGLPNPPEKEIQEKYHKYVVGTSKNRYGNLLVGSPLVALGYANWNENNSGDLEEELGVTGRVADGGAIINYRDADGEDYSITLVAEKGKLWENGQAHDQQDNMSFTLSSTKDGHIVRDMGYSGFGDNDFVHGYKDHNVLMRPIHPELTDGKGNHTLRVSELVNRAERYTHDYTGYGTYGLLGLFSDNLADYGATGAGGSQAFLVDSIRTEGVLGYTFYQLTNGGVLTNPLTNEEERIEPIETYRSIAYFGETLWLFDQPSDSNLLWVINGSTQGSGIQGTYFDEKVDVYIGSHLASNFNPCENVGATQNISRADYQGRFIWACRQSINLNDIYNEDENEFKLPITMVYSFDLANTFRPADGCNNANVQCFKRTEDNIEQRVIVPARNVVYRVSDVLTDVPSSNLSTYNGIMFAERHGNENWTVLGALNDGADVNKLMVKTKYLPSNLLLRGF